MQRILEATHPAQYCCAAQQSNSIHFLNVLASLAFKLSVSQSRGVIGDIIHYFTLMSLKLTLFLDIIHYFFKGTKIMPLFLKKFQKLLIIFKNFLLKPNFSEVEIGSQALGLLLTAQSAFDREREMGSQGFFEHRLSFISV